MHTVVTASQENSTESVDSKVNPYCHRCDPMAATSEESDKLRIGILMMVESDQGHDVDDERNRCCQGGEV